jgi:cytoskeletal protein CcmA (bactofilin family)
VSGKVNGEITASQRIEIHPTAKVTGNITAPTLVIQEGAFFEGSCSMTSEGKDWKPAASTNGAHPEPVANA